MPPGTAGLVIYQGDDYALLVSFNAPVGVPYPIDGFSFRAQIRPLSADADGTTDPLAELECSIVDAAAGTIQIGLAGAETETLPTKPSRWDLEGTDVGGRVTTYLAGPVTVLAEVTR